MRRSRSRTRRALSPTASPWCAAGTHWLIRTTALLRSGLLRQRPVQRGPELAQLLVAFGEAHLVPEARRDPAGRSRRGAAHLFDEARQRAGEVPVAEPLQCRVLRLDHRLPEAVL